MARSGGRFGLLALCVGVTACSQSLDFDLRNNFGDRVLDTSSAARAAAGQRPAPDSRGILKYPNYEVAVARRGDTLMSLADRIGVPVGDLASYNGIPVESNLNAGQVIALPNGATSAPMETNQGQQLTPTIVDISELEPEPTARSTNTAEPGRHRVAQGETAFTIARKYGIPVETLAEWNGLDRDLAVRPDQVLLIPQSRSDSASIGATTNPGQGSATPIPPSSTRPQPREEVTPVAAPAPKTEPTKPVADLGPTTSASSSNTKFVRPINGSIIRDYRKGSNEGIDFGAPAGTAVKAADAGTVAAVTQDTKGVWIVVIKHANNILTVYTNVDGLKVKKGDRVSRGQTIAAVKADNPSFLHFEVRKGLNSVDPNEYI